MNKKIIIFIIIIIIITVIIINKTIAGVGNSIKTSHDFVVINNTKINIIKAKTEQEIQKGLGGFKTLPPDTGMLFFMNNRAVHTFWMKEMKFPLDIIWIDDDQIVDINKNVPVEKGLSLKLYKPGKPANFVLEVPAGYCEKNNINVSDKISGIDKI